MAKKTRFNVYCEGFYLGDDALYPMVGNTEGPLTEKRLTQVVKLIEQCPNFYEDRFDREKVREVLEALGFRQKEKE